MRKWNRIFVMPGVLLMAVFLATNLFSEQIDTGNPSLVQTLSQSSTGDAQLKKSEVIQKTKNFWIPKVDQLK